MSTNDTPLIPSARRSAGSNVPWGSAGRGGASEERVTNRARRMVEGLPSWEPLPPGEILVRRPASS